ncbi:MAG: hypothetical protein MRQ13_04955 [Candidatus Midichloria sp.]|nr:hypothetical protein [Candidatus Midichloria sp.]
MKAIANIVEAMKDLEFVQNFKKPAERGIITIGIQKLPANQFSSNNPILYIDKIIAKTAIIKVDNLAIVKARFSDIGINFFIIS